MPDPTHCLVLLHHHGRQPRGAWFEVEHRAALTEAAMQPHHALVELDAAKLKELAPDMPAGKLGPNGRPDALPLIMAGAFQRLLALAKVGTLVATTAAAANQPPAKSGLPPPWSQVTVGAVVLASDAQAEGWWECVVVAIEAGNTLRLRWRDYPDIEYFTKGVDRVAMLLPGGQR